MPGGCQVDLGGTIGVVIVEVDIEEEGPMAVGSAVGAHDEGLHEIDPVLVAPHVDRIGVLVGKCSGDVRKFLSQSDHFGLVRLVAGVEIRCVVMFYLGRRFLHIHIVESQILHQGSVSFVQGQRQSMLNLSDVLLLITQFNHSLVDNGICSNYVVC
jgi:hypothetical protein